MHPHFQIQKKKPTNQQKNQTTGNSAQKNKHFFP